MKGIKLNSIIIQVLYLFQEFEKIIALSTMDAETAIIKMIKSGASGYVLKDAEPSELKLAFDEVISQGYFYNDLVTRKVMRSVNLLTGSNNTIATFAKLTTREIEFLKYACTEMAYKEIADKLNVSTRTVEGYRDALCEKLNLKTRVGLALYAIKKSISPFISFHSIKHSTTYAASNILFHIAWCLTNRNITSLFVIFH